MRLHWIFGSLLATTLTMSAGAEGRSRAWGKKRAAASRAEALASAASNSRLMTTASAPLASAAARLVSSSPGVMMSERIGEKIRPRRSRAPDGA